MCVDYIRYTKSVLLKSLKHKNLPLNNDNCFDIIANSQDFTIKYDLEK